MGVDEPSSKSREPKLTHLARITLRKLLPDQDPTPAAVAQFSDVDLLRTKGCGSKTYRLISAWVKHHGYELAPPRHNGYGDSPFIPPARNPLFRDLSDRAFYWLGRAMLVKFASQIPYSDLSPEYFSEADREKKKAIRRAGELSGELNMTRETMLSIDRAKLGRFLRKRPVELAEITTWLDSLAANGSDATHKAIN